MRRWAFRLACAMLMVATTAWAHHSGAGVDRTRTVTITGVVKEFRWTNPHSWIDLEVTEPLDLGALFDSLDAMIASREGWRIERVARLATFSFARFDLEDSREKRYCFGTFFVMRPDPRCRCSA